MKLRHAAQNAFSIGLFSAIFLCVLPLVGAAQGKIAFHSVRDISTGGGSEIYIMNADGSNQTRLTTTPNNEVSPDLSSDGSKIAFVCGTFPFDICVMNADGSNPINLTNSSTEEEGSPSFSSDGSKIVFSSDSTVDSGAHPNIYVMNVDGSNRIRLTNNSFYDISPVFSPDGSKIAFVSLRPDDPGTFQIYSMNADGSNQTRLTSSTTNFNSSPSFSPDGIRIVYYSLGQFAPDSQSEIYIMNADGSNQTRITNNAVQDATPVFSPDGSKIAFVSTNANNVPNIFEMNTDGTNRVNVSNTPMAADFQPSWGGPVNTAPTISALGATAARDSSVSNVSIASVNDTEDAENTLSVMINGSSSATANGVTVSGIAVSSTGGVTANVAATCGASNASFTLRVTDGGSLFSEATLNVSVTNETTAPTLVLPSDIVTSLPPNSTDTGKVVSFTVSATDNCDASPVVMASPASGSVFSVGTTTVNVTGTDASGNTATGSFTVTVLYSFAGFFQPVDNLPIVNIVSAGQSVPIKFSLSGDKGLNIFAAGYPISQQVACTGGSSTSTVDETVTAGSSSLIYDAAADRYLYVWKTERTWRGTCRRLTVKLNDGSLHVASFQFK